MHYSTRVIMLLAAPLALAACAEEADETVPADTAMNENMEMSSDMPMMEDGQTGRIASAQGTITSIDDDAGTITIDHGPVPEVEWPAMTMGFAASEEQRASVAEGDEVSFTFEKTGTGGEIVSLSKE